jgi:hypothetical protein
MYTAKWCCLCQIFNGNSSKTTEILKSGPLHGPDFLFHQKVFLSSYDFFLTILVYKEHIPLS